MKKRTTVPAYILLLSLSNKLKLLVNHYGTPCTFKTIQRMGGGQSFPPKIHFLMWFVNSAFRRAYIRIYKARLESNNRRGVYLILKSPSVCLSFIHSFCHSSQIFPSCDWLRRQFLAGVLASQ